MKLLLENVCFAYGSRALLKNVCLSVPTGKILSVIGPSGVGKTTLLKLISGQLQPTAGRIVIDGQDMAGIPPEKRNVGFVFQSPLLFPHMTVAQNICFGLDVRKTDRSVMRDRCAYLLELLRLEGLGDRMPAEISGGQQQRTAIARALAPEPKLLLMDEPFSNLDPALRYEMGSLIKTLQRETGVTIVFVTHDREESMLLSHEIAVMMAGEVKQTAPPQHLFYQPESLLVGDYMGLGNRIPGRIREGRFISALREFAQVPLRADLPEGTAGWLYVRPHQLELISGREGWRIAERQVVGKNCLYLLENETDRLYVETYSDTLHEVGSAAEIALKPGARHFIPSSENGDIL